MIIVLPKTTGSIRLRLDPLGLFQCPFRTSSNGGATRLNGNSLAEAAL